MFIYIFISNTQIHKRKEASIHHLVHLNKRHKQKTNKDKYTSLTRISLKEEADLL